MAAPRLPFLWPMLYRTIEAPASRSSKAAARIRAFHRTAPQGQQETVPSQRYGPANEPPPHIDAVGKTVASSTSSAKKSDQESSKKLPLISERVPVDGEQSAATQEKALPKEDPPKEKPTAAEEKEKEKEKPVESLLDSIPSPAKAAQKDKINSIIDNPSSTTTSTKSTEESLNPNSHPPHLDTPRHVHHFDTYGLVRRLNTGNWSDDQAITLMKAMRVQLASNLDLANKALVSKSMVENETYLFRAACAELKTEVTSRRRAEQDKMRTERTQLQHEVDILSQRIGQEIAGLKDELKGMFDDRKMSVRNEQRSMESRLQQINYKITVALQADAKSDVEGLRWVMTRRVIIALGAVIFMVVGSLKLYSNAIHENELEAKRRANMKSGGTQTDEREQGAGVGVGGEMLVKVNEGDNPSFVSLG